MTLSRRPSTAEQWQVYLAEYSADFLRVADVDRLHRLGDERLASGWLGFAGAGPDALAAVEERLGMTLPAGYRAFLEASDGWLEMGPFVWTMRTTADVGWLRDIEPELCDAGDEDDELMARALLVSADADACYWLLDPADVNDNGEWAAYVWASWYPGLGDRFDSFADLVVAERESFERSVPERGGQSNPQELRSLSTRGAGWPYEATLKERQSGSSRQPARAPEQGSTLPSSWRRSCSLRCTTGFETMYWPTRTSSKLSAQDGYVPSLCRCSCSASRAHGPSSS